MTHDAQRAGGFTLMELMLALTLSATLATGIYATFHQSQRAEARATEQSETRQVGRVALEWLGRDLAALVRYQSAFNPGLVGLDADFDGADADTLYFTATSHLPAWRELDEDASVAAGNPLATAFGVPDTPAPAADVAQIEYYLGTDAENDPPGLVRRVRTLPTAETTDVDTTFAIQPIARSVVGFDVKYYDGGDWLDDWDSAQSQTYPQAVQVSVTVRVGDLERYLDADGVLADDIETRTFTRTIVFDVEPFVDQQPQQQQPAGGGSGQ